LNDDLRLTDILTTASAVANYLGVPEVRASHVRDAIAILQDRKSMDDLGRPQSPMLSRLIGSGKGADPAVAELARHWFERLGGDVTATLDEAALTEFEAALEALENPNAS